MLTISTSFGDSWFAGTHTRNKEKTSTRHNRNTQKTSSCVTITRWAHLTEHANQHTEPRHRRTQDGGPPGSVQDERRCKRHHPGVGRTPGSPEPFLAPTGTSFGRKIATAIPTSVPSVPIFDSRRNRPIQAIKGGGETLL